jgi:5'-nucleotidase
MIILLTNDDGIQSPKLHYTKDILSQYGTVYVVAPKVEQSAKSMALTIGGFTFEKVDDYTYLIEGTPVDCVNFAYAGLKLQPDIVVSGTNNGYNLGIDTRYSGTVGAVLQAQYFGFKSVAFSSDRLGDRMLKLELQKTFEYILQHDLLSTEYSLNVNFPREKFEQANGIMETTIHYHKFQYFPTIEGSTFKPNRTYIHEGNLPENTDTWAYSKGYTSISKITV